MNAETLHAIDAVLVRKPGHRLTFARFLLAVRRWSAANDFPVPTQADLHIGLAAIGIPLVDTDYGPSLVDVRISAPVHCHYMKRAA